MDELRIGRRTGRRCDRDGADLRKRQILSAHGQEATEGESRTGENYERRATHLIVLDITRKVWLPGGKLALLGQFALIDGKYQNHCKHKYSLNAKPMYSGLSEHSLRSVGQRE